MTGFGSLLGGSRSLSQRERMGGTGRGRSVASRVRPLLVLVGGLVFGDPGVAQAADFACNPCITTDGSLGAITQFSGNNISIPSNLGTLRSPNLFHSFTLFNVPTNGVATFTRSTTTPQNQVSNIIARVTGGQSMIDGKVAVASGTLGFSANTSLYLINPSGLIFGPNAAIGPLDVRGSFHVSSADYLRLGTNCPANCVQFSSHSQPINSGLPTTGFNVAPAAFGFTTSNPAAISITQGSATKASLVVGANRVLSIVGGPIDIIGPGTLRDAVVPPQTNAPTVVAPGGRVQIVSVASPGEAVMTGGATPDITVNTSTALGTVNLSNRAIIDATSDTNGTVLIRAGKLIMRNSQIFSDSDAFAGAARAIDIRVTGDMVLDNKAEISAGSFGEEVGGDIVATVGSLSLTGGSLISRTSQSQAFGNQPTAGVTVDSRGPITISGTNSGLFSNTALNENLGGVTITASSLTMSERGQISSVASQSGLSGNISVDVGKGPVTVTSGAKIFSNSGSGAPAAKINVVADSVVLSGRDPLNASNSSGIVSGSGFGGPPGDVFLKVGSLTVTD